MLTAQGSVPIEKLCGRKRAVTARAVCCAESGPGGVAAPTSDGVAQFTVFLVVQGDQEGPLLESASESEAFSRGVWCNRTFPYENGSDFDCRGLSPVPRPLPVMVRADDLAQGDLSEQTLDRGGFVDQIHDVGGLAPLNVVEIHHVRGVGLLAVRTYSARSDLIDQ